MKQFLSLGMMLVVSLIISQNGAAFAQSLIPGMTPPVVSFPDGKLDSSVMVIVRYEEGFPNDSAQNLLSQLGANILYSAPYFLRLTIRVDSNLIETIQNYPWVTSVEEILEPVTYNDGSRASINADKVLALPYGISNPYRLSGQGVNVGIWDAGPPDIANNDFTGRLVQVEPTGTSPCDGMPIHSTHVAGTMAGTGINSTNVTGGTPYKWCGMAPQANIFGWSMYTYTIANGCLSAPHTPDEMLSGVTNQNIVIANNSWGYAVTATTCPIFRAYQWECPDFDKLVREKNLSLVFSAGNWRNEPEALACGYASGYGTITPPATAKNVITVGAVTKTDAMTSFSSWGPLMDGRLNHSGLKIQRFD